MLFLVANVHSAKLTGAFTFSSDADGNPAGDFAWDTRGEDSDYYKVFVAGGTPGGSPDGLTSDFINGPAWAQAPLNIDLTEGTNQFTVFFQANGPWPAFGLNLFFVNSQGAQICVKGPARTNETIPEFSANSAPRTFSMTSYPYPDRPASGSTRATVGDVEVELTEYYVAVAEFFNADRVDTHATGTNGRLDYVGTFTLVVRPAPPPPPPPPPGIPRLTGVFTFSSDVDGNFAGDFVWDTRGTESDFYKVWLTPGTPGGIPDGLITPFFNGPTWALAPVNLPLLLGSNQFTIFFQDNGPWPMFGLNLFLQDSNIAQICVKGHARTNEDIPPFSLNTASNTFSMSSFPYADAPASGSRRTVIGDLVVELTDYYVAAASFFSLDRVDTHATGTNGRVDYVGTFNLVVRPQQIDGGTNEIVPGQSLEVISVCEGIVAVCDILEAANLPRRSARPLRTALAQALRYAENGNYDAAKELLEAFQHKVAVQVARFNPDLAEALIDAAQVMIDVLNYHDGD